MWFDLLQVRVFVLDAETALSTQALLEVGVPAAHIVLANLHLPVCQAIRQRRLLPPSNVVHANAIDYLRDVTKIDFNCLYLDTCSQPDVANQMLDAALQGGAHTEMLVALTFTQARLLSHHLDFSRKVKRPSSKATTLVAATALFSHTASRHGFQMQTQYHQQSEHMHFLLFWLQREDLQREE